MASRILGLGDVLTLIEQAEAVLEEKEAAELEKRLRARQFDLNDFLREVQRLTKMGPLENLLGMIPGMQALRQRGPLEVDPKQMGRMVAIMRSMTPQERDQPDLIDGSRRRRIARGSGSTPQDVNMLLKQFRQMRSMLLQFADAEKTGRLPKGFGIPGFRP